MKVKTDIACNTIIEDSFEEGFVYVYILQYKDGTTQSFVRSEQNMSITFTIGEDGYYTIGKLTIPRDTSSPCYYSDGKFYYHSEVATIQEIMAANPLATNVNIEYYPYFLMCNIRKCYVEEANRIMKSSTRCSIGNTYKRDLLWCILKVIEYLVLDKQYEEAYDIIKRVSSCNGLCSPRCNCQKNY